MKSTISNIIEMGFLDDLKIWRFQHGEVCPAGWTPGKETIKPGVKDSQVKNIICIRPLKAYLLAYFCEVIEKLLNLEKHDSFKMTDSDKS